MTDYAWISRLLRDAAFTCRENCHDVWKVTYFGEFGFLSSSSIRKSTILMFLSPSRDKFTLLWHNSQWQMFLLVSGCHVGVHPDGEGLYMLPYFFFRTLDFIYWTIFILFPSILNGVTLKTSHTTLCRTLQHSTTYCVTYHAEWRRKYKHSLIWHIVARAISSHLLHNS